MTPFESAVRGSLEGSHGDRVYVSDDERGHRATPLSGTQLAANYSWFASALDAAGAPRITPHDLRHTAASFAVSAGANVKAVQRMLGHASAAMTLDTYAELFDKDLDAVGDALDGAATRAGVVKKWSDRAEEA